MIKDSLRNQKNFDKIAIITDGTHFSYYDLMQKAFSIQQQFSKYQRECISIFLPNGADYISALYGTWAAGMTAFPMNIQLTTHEIIPLLLHTSARVVITSKAYHPLFQELKKSVPITILYVEDLPKSKQNAFPPVEMIDADEAIILLATSGTTGNVKIVQLSEKNVASSTFSYIEKMDFKELPENEIRFTLGTPFSSVYGLMVLTACIIKSFPIVVIRERFTLETLYKAAEKHKITHFEGGVSIGLLMEQMAGRPIPYDISSFRYFGLAGSKLSGDTLKRLIRSYPDIEFWTGYGMTEAGPLIAKPDKKVNLEKLDSVGTKIDCVKIMIDVNGTLTTAPNVKGELVVKGPNIMLGYYKNEEATQNILRDGYLYTGDIGYFDEDGYIYICGRKKNVIIVRGFNVHAEEVEACIMNSGFVKDCIVYNKTDSLEQEILCADIIPMSSQVQTAEIHSYCKDHLATYKCPHTIKVVDRIEKTVTGKTERAY